MTEQERRPAFSGTSAPFRVVQGGRQAAARRTSFGPSADLIGRMAEADVAVLLRGERGTGKGLVARAMHAASARRDRAFVKIDCTAAPQTLETELFGCVPGDGSGASQPRPGRLEFAHHGTLFLNHVCELSAPLQLRLLRVLDDGGFARVVSDEPIRVDLRVIASSERDLERAVVDGLFREDLFVKLNGVCLTLPPLRQRRSEMRELADFFLRHYALHYNKPEVTVSAETLRLFGEYRWPSNLEELEAIAQRIVMRGNDSWVREELTRAAAEQGEERRRPVSAVEDRPRLAGPAAATSNTDLFGVNTPVPLKEIARQAADGAERELIYRTLQHTRWNRRQAAQILGVSYKALLYKIKRAELEGGP